MNPVVVLQRLGIIASKLTPRRFADAIARAIGVAFYHLSPRRRGYIRDNVNHILPDRDAGGLKERIVKQTFINFALSMVDFFRLSYMLENDFEVDCHGIEHIDRARALQRGCVLISLHIGSWDYGGAYLAARGIPILALVQMTDPTMFQLYTRHRERTGLRTYPVAKAPYAFIEAMKKNKVLAILADRNVHGPGRIVKFFSGSRRIPLGLSEMIGRYDIPAVLSYLVMQRRGKRYRLTIEPMSYDRHDVDALERKIIREFENIISRYPDQWFVFHPEWIEHEEAEAFAENHD